MNETIKKLLTVALMVIVLVYTFFNYSNGKISILALGLSCCMIGYPMLVIISSLISDLKNR